ncbi:MAG TPA: porin [Thermoanaerobaculia bacterium]|nr:porin [Thermoanaerobaculia bacterium]
MHWKSLTVCLALAMCAAAFADDAKITTEAIEQAAAETVEQTPPPQQPEPGSDEILPGTPTTPPTTEELAGKLESFGEAFTEMRNSLENLNRMRFSGYLQAQYLNDERSVNELTSPTATGNLDQFSVRRARLKFTYQFNPTSRFVLQPDITSSGVTLKDGYVEFTEPWTSWKHTLTAGQFNWPFGFEIMYSSSAREVPERSRVVRTLFPGERDRGVMLSGLGLGDRLSYRVAIVNGTGTGQSFDFNKRKDLVGRVGYSFGVVDVGGSVYRGSDLVTVAGNTRGIEFDKERQGVDLQWITPIPGLGLRGEYVTGKQAPASGTTRTQSQDVEGWYFYAIQNFGTKHQLVVRADEYDPDTDVDGNAVRTLNPTYIFHWDANSKVMASYEFIDTQRNDPDDNVFTLRYQYSF